MSKSLFTLSRSAVVLLAAAAIFGSLSLTKAQGIDFADSPSMAQDPGADIGDAYIFLDPNDNTQAVLAVTVHGFLAPGAPLNTAAFDPNVQFTFEVENTGDAVADKKIKVTFDAPAFPGAAQTARVKGAIPAFSALSTPATLATSANPAKVTDAPGGFQFFAGPIADPSFGDLVAVTRYLASARRGATDPATLRRGRNTSAGYNAMGIAIKAPVSFLRGTSTTLGLSVVTKRRPQTPNKTGGYTSEGKWVGVDRAAVPGVNTFFIPSARQDEYNASKPADDAAAKFAADFSSELRSVGTSDPFIGILKGIAATRGDFLRLDFSIANSGAGGGENAAAGFPNGRRLKDDVIDTLLTFVANGSPLGDGVTASDAAPQSTFPFFALPHQPQ